MKPSHPITELQWINMMRWNITVLLHVILGLTAFWKASTGFSVAVTTNPAGPSYKAGTLFTVQCLIINGSLPYNWYYYEWTYGCSYTDVHTVYDSGYNIPIVGYFATTSPYSCLNVFTCKASDNFIALSSAVGQIKVEIITDIGIQILPSPYALFATRNISILTVNESGKFLDIDCASGLRQPSLGKWIHPNGTEIGLGSDKYSIERGGGVASLPYVKLKLKDDYSAVPGQDTGLYTCKMLDLYQVERESHIWILPEDDFDDPVPEYFSSYSSANSLTVKCAYSGTPGEIIWYMGSDEISSNDQYKISQRLLQSSPFVLYEGVLEVAYSDIQSTVMDCTIYSSIIGNHADPFPSSYTISEIHYFFVSTIGQSETFICTFANSNITNTEVYRNGAYVTSNSASNISYTIELVKDTTHNEEYSCIGMDDEGNATSYVHLSIVALIPKHAIVMHGIVPEGTVSAGEPVTLTLSAVKATGFTFDQRIRCTDWNGDELSKIKGIDYPDDSIVGGQTLSIQVQIPSIRMSRAGMYYCDAILETPTNLDNLSDSINFTLEIKAPSPSFLSLANSIPSTTAFKAGSTALFRCNASLNLSSFIDVPIDCIFKWTINGTTITSTHTRYSLYETITVDSNSSNTTEWYSQLQIAPVLKIDESAIDCSARIVAGTDNAEHIVPSDWIKSSLNIIVEGLGELTTVPVELTFAAGIITCSQLLLYSEENKMIITDILVTILVESCNCHYLPNFITNQSLLCRHHGSDDSTQLLSYKAELYSTDIVDASVLGEYLLNYDWANSTIAQDITLKINKNQNIVLAINKKCQVVLNDDSSARCDSSTKHSSSPLNTWPSTGGPLSTKITKWSSTTSSSLSIATVDDESSTIATAHTLDSTPLIIYTVTGLVSIVFISCLSCVFIVGLIILLRKRKTSERIIINSNLTSNVVPPEEAVCYTTSMNNYTYDTWNNENEISKRQLPKLPAETRMDDIDRIKHDNRFRDNLHDCLTKQDSEIYTEMDGGLVQPSAQDYEDPQQMDHDDDSVGHNYEDLEKYQKELDGVYVKPSGFK